MTRTAAAVSDFATESAGSAGKYEYNFFSASSAASAVKVDSGTMTLFLAAALALAAGCEGVEQDRGPAPPRQPRNIRQPAVAGAFYPGDAAALLLDVKNRLGRVRKSSIPPGTVTGILAPHAGYDYSGDVAAAAFKAASGGKFDVIVLIGAPHRVPVRFAAVADYDAFRTPLGNVPVDTKVVAALVKAGIEPLNAAHAPEHSLEVQLPFVQALFPDVPIVPILVGSDDQDDHKRVAAILHQALEGKAPLVVISSDLSHYPDYATARMSDGAVLDAVLTLDAAAVAKTIVDCEFRYRARGVDTAACGANAILTGLALLAMMNTDGAKLLDSRNSGDAPGIGDKARVVGYGAVVFFRKAEHVKEPSEQRLSPAARKELLAIARRALEAAVNGQQPPEIKCTNPELQGKQGAFVTLKTRGELRGCLGVFESEQPLWLTVRDLARSSALNDPRFVMNRISKNELEDVDIEISVLSTLKRIKDPLSIRLGIDGIYIRSGWRSGVFLPQVATETGWSKEEFLSHCARDKAGLRPDAWKDPDTEVLTFTAEVFGDKEE